MSARADKGFDPEVLLDRFKEELNLPALFIDGGNRSGSQVVAIG
jgi:hypothetical protein